MMLNTSGKCGCLALFLISGEIIQSFHHEVWASCRCFSQMLSSLAGWGNSLFYFLLVEYFKTSWMALEQMSYFFCIYIRVWIFFLCWYYHWHCLSYECWTCIPRLTPMWPLYIILLYVIDTNHGWAPQWQFLNHMCLLRVSKTTFIFY